MSRKGHGLQLSIAVPLTEELSQLKEDYTYWRNRVRAFRRSRQRNTSVESMARSYKKRFHDIMLQQRKAHWEDFCRRHKKHLHSLPIP